MLWWLFLCEGRCSGGALCSTKKLNKMQAEPDYSEIYKAKIVPQINRWGIKVLLIFIASGLICFFIDYLKKYFPIPFWVSMPILLAVGIFYVKQIFSIEKIMCPHCHKQLFPRMSFGSHLRKHCTHCNVKLR